MSIIGDFDFKKPEEIVAFLVLHRQRTGQIPVAILLHNADFVVLARTVVERGIAANTMAPTTKPPDFIIFNGGTSVQQAASEYMYEHHVGPGNPLIITTSPPQLRKPAYVN